MTQPAHFREDLQTRAFPHRYRKIGSPFEYLDDIGILPIVEYIYKGNTIIDCAAEMDIPVTHLLNWLDDRGYMQQIEDAYAWSAQGYLSQAARELRQATNEMAFKKAKEMLSHARFMASKHDRKKYGESANGKGGSGSGIQYFIQIGNDAPPETLKMVGDAMQSSAALVLEHEPQDDGAYDDIVVFEPPVPDIGPFADEEEDAGLRLGVDDAGT